MERGCPYAVIELTHYSEYRLEVVGKVSAWESAGPQFSMQW